MMYDLLYGGEFVSCSDSPFVLLDEKARLVFSRSVRYPALLEIYEHGCVPWIFDVEFTFRSASRYLSNVLFDRVL